MPSHNANDGQPEENYHAQHTTQPKEEHSEASKVLEIMRYLIVEIHSFKEDIMKMTLQNDNMRLEPYGRLETVGMTPRQPSAPN